MGIRNYVITGLLSVGLTGVGTVIYDNIESTPERVIVFDVNGDGNDDVIIQDHSGSRTGFLYTPKGYVRFDEDYKSKRIEQRKKENEQRFDEMKDTLSSIDRAIQNYKRK
jgi:hypothetical protein